MDLVTESLEAALRRALDARAGLVERLALEGTDSWRAFHGTSEGRPGLTIDRYGELVLVQTFRGPLAPSELETIRGLFDAPVVWNHRGGPRTSRYGDFSPDDEHSTREFVAREHGVRFPIRARHRGLDPWLFLDLRAGRRCLARIAEGKSVLNLFAYTGSAAVTALARGAREAWNVDFARSSLDVARRSLELNALDPARLVTVEEDFFAAARQLSGLPVKGRGASRPYVRLEPRTFDVVFLDPPAWSRGPFGAVDVVGDYPSLLKPALFALAPGGTLIATQHVAEVGIEAWKDVLERGARKCGRPLAALEFLGPDEDFPSFDARPPLKIAVATV